MEKILDVLGCSTVAKGLHRRFRYSDEKGTFLPTKPGRTPPGLPIPGSSRNPSILKLLRRLPALPLPLRMLGLAGQVIFREPADEMELPVGWSEYCNAGELSGIIGWTSKNCNNPAGFFSNGQGCITPPICALSNPINCGIDLQIVFPLALGANAPAGTRGIDWWEVSTINPARYRKVSGWTALSCPPQLPAGPFDPRVRVPRPLPKTQPKVWPKEWVWPDVIPEIVPPTAPKLEPPGRTRFSPTFAPEFDHPWTLPDFGTTRGPAPSARPTPFNPNPDFHAQPSPGVVTTPGPSTQPTPVAPGPGPIPTIPELDWPPIARTPIVSRGPNVELRIDPPGWTRQRLRPPGPRNKERKFIVAIPPGAASRIIGGITEGLDMVDCLHSSLPKAMQAKPKWYKQSDGTWKRSKKPSVSRKAAAIYKHMDDPLVTGMTLFNALTECGYQQAKDRFYAALGRAGGRAGRRLNLSHGFGLGGATRSAVTGGTTPTIR